MLDSYEVFNSIQEIKEAKQSYTKKKNWSCYNNASNFRIKMIVIVWFLCKRIMNFILFCKMLSFFVKSELSLK